MLSNVCDYCCFFFCTPLLATILSCRSLPNWPGIQHHHSHRHRKVRLSLMWNNPCLLLCQGSNPNLLVCCQNTTELLHLAQIQSWLRIFMARWFFSLQEDEEQDVEAVRKRNQKVISTLAVYFSSILLLVVWMVLGHTFSGDSSTFLAQNGRTPEWNCKRKFLWKKIQFISVRHKVIQVSWLQRLMIVTTLDLKGREQIFYCRGTWTQDPIVWPWSSEIGFVHV